MQILLQRPDIPNSSLGHRRGCSDLARFALDLSWARAGSESVSPSGDYPSPPMSGSPPPPRVTQEADVRVQGLYQAAGQDVYRRNPTTQEESRYQQGMPAAPGRSYSSEPIERMPYAFSRPDDSMHRNMPTYAPQHAQIMPQHQHQHQHSYQQHQQQQHPYLPAPVPLPGSAPTGYPVASRPMIPEAQQPYTSPKSQRKTKGHVASACVPCKKAHLRCDAQRPCTRCLQNGKEDACVDVQHKKRGRPRLRDDREARFDPSGSRFGHPQDPSSMRRPLSLSLYSSQGPVAPGYEDSLRRSQSYRVLKSQPPEMLAPRFLERGSASDMNIFPAPLSISTRPPEPAAFLTMDMEIAKASSTFAETVGQPLIQGRNIADVIHLGDRDKMLGLQRQMQDEQARKEPNYLPPIFGKQEEERVLQGLGFDSAEMAKYSLDRLEHFGFSDQAGQTRSLQVRMGLAKQDSIYFIVILLMPYRTYQHPTPSPQARDVRELPYAYSAQHQHQHQQHQHPYHQPTPVSATFDLGRGRSVSNLEMGYGQRQPMTPGQMMPGLSPRLPSTSYAASPSRPDYPVGPSSYQIPRSELPIVSRPQQPPGYQLPPIRNQQQHIQQQAPQQAQQQSRPSEQGWSRDGRQQVDISSLIERPDPSQRYQ